MEIVLQCFGIGVLLRLVVWLEQEMYFLQGIGGGSSSNLVYIVGGRLVFKQCWQ